MHGSQDRFVQPPYRFKFVNAQKRREFRRCLVAGKPHAMHMRRSTHVPVSRDEDGNLADQKHAPRNVGATLIALRARRNRLRNFYSVSQIGDRTPNKVSETISAATA